MGAGRDRLYTSVPTFADRFEGSAVHGRNRLPLSFTDELAHLGRIKDEWTFVENETLRSNIASELQKVHFDILLVNKYNVYYSPEALTMKHAIIACASVAEAVLEVVVKMIQDDPRVLAIIETRERVFDEMYTLQLKEFETPDGTRVVTGVQREVVRSRLDRNTKMDILIRAAQAGGVVDEEMAKKLQHLRKFRNRVHIKTVEELEYSSYKHGVTNAMIDILEEFRLVAMAQIEDYRRASMVDDLLQSAGDSMAGVPAASVEWGLPISAPTTFGVDDLVEHATLGSGIVVAAEGDLYTVRFAADGSLRRLLVPYAPLRKVGVVSPSDDIPF